MAPATKRRRVEQPQPGHLSSSSSNSINIASYGRISRSASIAAAHKVKDQKATAAAAAAAAISIATATPPRKQQLLHETDCNVLNRLGRGNGNGKGTHKSEDKVQLSADGCKTLKRKQDASAGPVLLPQRKALKAEDNASVYVKLEAEHVEPLPPPIVDIAVIPPPPSHYTQQQQQQQQQQQEAANNADISQRAHSRLANLTPRPSPATSYPKSKSPAERSSQSHLQSQSQSPPTSSLSENVTTPCPRKRRHDILDELPQSLQDLVDLQSSFLTALSLHYAHQGTAVPVDIKHLGPSIAKVWGRRAVTTQHIRRLLGIQQRSGEDLASSALLSVWDYGRGKTVIEYCNPPASGPVKTEIKEEIKSENSSKGAPTKRAWGAGSHSLTRQPLNVSYLSRGFASWIREHWTAFCVNEGPNGTPDEFIDTIPLARLHRRAATRTAKSSVLSKGQARLTELKSGAVARYAKDASKDDLASQSRITSNTAISLTATDTTITPSDKLPNDSASASVPNSQSRPSLLSRIRAKESLLAAQAAGPTPEQLARRTALHRIPDVFSILTVLAGNCSNNVGSYFFASRSGLQPSSNGPLLAQRMSNVSLGGCSGNSDDALLAALGGGSMKGSRSGSTSSTATSSSARGLAGLFGSGSDSSPSYSPMLSPLSSIKDASRFVSASSPASYAVAPTTPASLTLSLSQVVERIQNSSRAPVPRAEAELAVRILADEIAPAWLTVRTVGAVTAVVIRGGAGAGLAMGWREKVAELLAAS